jgi:hypothetical protein
MHLLQIKCLNIFFLNGFVNKNSKILNGFNLIILYHFHSPQKITTKNLTHKLNFEVFI